MVIGIPQNLSVLLKSLQLQSPRILHFVLVPEGLLTLRNGYQITSRIGTCWEHRPEDHLLRK
jgi:hypothetical protein